MNTNQNKQLVTCPKCAEQINVSALLHNQIEAELHQAFTSRLAEKQNQFEHQLKSEKAQLEQNLKARLAAESSEQMQAMRNELNAKSEQLREFNKAKADVERLMREKSELKETLEAESEAKLNQRLREERQKLEQSLKANFEAEARDQMQAMSDELNQKSEQLREFNKAKADIERLTREKFELKETIEAEAEFKLSQRLREERQKIESGLELKMRDKEYEIEKLKHQIQEAQRVAEQGSNQAQGEVQELAIEEWLRDKFRDDEIIEIKKGQRGADCIQIVYSRARVLCGKICYESKRTEHFNKDWIEKLKTDSRSENATISVLVTKTMPKELDRMGLYEGIWVCTFEEFKGLSAVLRESVIQISSLVATQENKGEKKEMLYNFVTSNAFKSQIDAMNETFSQMREDLHKERTSMQRLWAQREKQIEKLSLNTSHNLGAIEGIIGNVIQNDVQLESNVKVVESVKPVPVSQPVVKSNLGGVKQDSLF
ncbi:MAG: DUF2130 domain-containing protein [Methylococcales bacterium]|nr:DUF2130 domain-containing protein [Methylococcales bacterium]MDD5755272.1 DUF2130 domain-containing protein [Methylococcales bacterium]